MKRLIAWLLILCLLLSIGSLVRANEPTTAPGFCETIASLIGGELVEWVGYPVGWILPDDLRITEIDSFPQDGGLVKYSSESQQADYYFFFWSYRVSGEPLGQHDFCGPYRIDRKG